MFTFASEETYKEGRIIFEEGSSEENVYVILSGSVELSKMIGRKKVVVEILRKGGIFGEVDLYMPVKRSTTARAILETTLGLIDLDSMYKEINKLSPDFKSVFAALLKRSKKVMDTTCELTWRKEPRVRKNLAVTYEVDKSSVTACSNDISTQGLSVITKKPLRKGEAFFLELKMPGLLDPVKINSEVAWVREPDKEKGEGSFRMGVRFLEMKEQDNDMLNHYVNTVRLCN
jgi:CRP/FNR family transcriptional regulator, cyclic AMP receptor protein